MPAAMIRIAIPVVYAPEAVKSAAWKCGGRIQQSDAGLSVMLPEDGSTEKEFFELLAYEDIRASLEQRFTTLREALVKKAFGP